MGDHSRDVAQKMGEVMFEEYTSIILEAVDRLMLHLVDALLTAQSDSTTRIQQRLLESM